MRPIPSILVIDDNADALETLATLLNVLGTETVRQAKSAEQALEIIKTESFTLIISDYRLEGMNGVEFLDQLRAQGNQTPVLLLSGAPDTLGVIRATNHQKVDFFGKPFQMGEFVDAVERLAEAA
jgi:two-component system response regulator HydG